jgi:hypothetical protein
VKCVLEIDEPGGAERRCRAAFVGKGDVVLELPIEPLCRFGEILAHRRSTAAPERSRPDQCGEEP